MIKFGLSYVLLSVLSSLMCVGILMLVLKGMKMTFDMDGEKWNRTLGYKTGSGLYYILAGTYIFTVLVMLPISVIWFNVVGIENPILGSVIIMVALTVSGGIKFPKIKAMIQSRCESIFS
ncbi:hypothetical protein [uncultured Clostridium sp.]|uniref:hypothetical protein n=1 Tax=uncultured Clostridium sp. TaxID=59620 RepID=UPI00262A0EAD|nr:hypothetical protein [uncultured Clostridium sp.]